MLNQLSAAYTATMSTYNSVTADHTEALATQLETVATDLRTAVETEPRLAYNTRAQAHLLECADHAEWCARQVRRSL